MKLISPMDLFAYVVGVCVCIYIYMRMHSEISELIDKLQLSTKAIQSNSSN